MPRIRKNFVLQPGQAVTIVGPSLAEKEPEIARLWHVKRNGTLGPTQVGCATKALVWWQCPQGHEWEQSVLHQVLNPGCSYCKGYYITDANSLATNYPEIAKEWHPRKNRRLWFESGGSFKIVQNMRIAPERKGKNRRLKPADLASTSVEIVWWLCENGHEWQDRVCDRAIRGQGCNECKRNAVAKTGSLAVLFPGLSKLWHPTRNTLTPADVIPGASAVVWWRCPKVASHVWDAPVKTVLRSHTITRTHGCPFCSRHRVDPKNSLSTKCAKAAKLWHPTKNENLSPTHVAAGSKNRVFWQCSAGHEWDAQIYNVVKVVQQGKGACPTCSRIKVVPPGNSLSDLFPEVAAMWHPTKNGKLNPSQVSTGSVKEIHWVCRKNSEHEFTASVNYITKLVKKGSKNYGCARCRGRTTANKRSSRLLPDVEQSSDTTKNLPLKPIEVKPFSVTKVTHPELAAEWHKSKNGQLSLEDVTHGSPQEVWWKCSKNRRHDYQATVEKRVLGTGCPCCANRKSLTAANSLAVTHPQIAKMWHSGKNTEVSPTEVVAGSAKKVWWQCEILSHVWQRSIMHQVGSGGTCPYCIGRRACDTNCLAFTHPDLTMQWHAERNGDLSPSDVTRGSEKKVWWRCLASPDHSFQAAVHERIRGRGCPLCANRIIDQGNCLSTTHIDIAQQWHPSKNGRVTPTDVHSGSTKKIWWQCEKADDHVWQSHVYVRAAGHGCPYCKGLIASQDHNLMKLEPLVAQYWHKELNPELTPFDVTPGSTKKVWWKCSYGHEWQAVVGNVVRSRRRFMTTGCPVCAKEEQVKRISSRNLKSRAKLDAAKYQQEKLARADDEAARREEKRKKELL